AAVESSVDAAAEVRPGSNAESRITSNAIHFASLNERATKVCDGLTGRQTSMSWEFMLLAANQGSVAAAVRFAGLPPMDFQHFAVDAEAWAAYRDNAPRLLDFAAQQGDPRALFLLSRILSGRNLLFG